MEFLIPTEQQRKILVVDDEEKNRLAISAVLRHAPEPYTVLTAPNGLVGCKMAEAQKPDLIIMDWVMPEMSGLEALMYLKEREETRDIPVVMLTGLGSSKHVEYALNAGAADYLRIPVDKTELLARVQAAIALASSYRHIKAQSERLEEQNKQLLDLNEEKNEFLGIAAHDLKNPLNNITDLARIIETEIESMPQSEIQEFARLIRQSANKMFELVRNLLDVNAIEQGGIKPHLTSFDVREIVNRVVESYTQRAASKTIHLNFTFPDEDTITFADERLTEQVVENLVSNAVKYSPHGKNIVVTIHQPTASQDCITISVKDEGPGISEEDQKKMFGKFARLTAQPTGGEHSTGLGLSIVKQLAEVMKGKVWCESRLGEGATFFLELPRVRV
ncbi:MAG: hybrid sensor histidine kinase/response regulator [Candidatus Kapabacteria bacterium]|jgi:signal transduction histidine kinase|nr:hybrid sensor histidine kinase/response regulator [Candidatus Kapabacteria bacterium]